MIEREIAETYEGMSDDDLARWLQVHRRRVLEAEQDLRAKRAALKPFENERRRRDRAQGARP